MTQLLQKFPKDRGLEDKPKLKQQPKTAAKQLQESGFVKYH